MTATLEPKTANVIRSVKLIGFESKNGRYYAPSVLKSAVHLYEGAKVNIDHPDSPDNSRKYGERIGVVRNARFVEGKGIFADFYFNPKHACAEQLRWDAENAPESVGFSHNALLRLGAIQDGRQVVDKIEAIRSIDLVADPATTSSLFESTIRQRSSHDGTLPIQRELLQRQLELHMEAERIRGYEGELLRLQEQHRRYNPASNKTFASSILK